MIRNLHVVLALIAGILVGCISININDSIEVFFLKMILTLVFFFVVGKFFRDKFLMIVNQTNQRELEKKEFIEDELNENADLNELDALGDIGEEVVEKSSTVDSLKHIGLEN